MLDRPEVLVIFRLLAGQQSVERVMKVVVPLGVTSVPSLLPRTNHPDIIQRTFKYQVHVSLQFLSSAVDRLRQLCQERPGRLVEDGVHGVKAQRVEMKLSNPIERIFDEEAAHVITVRPVKVNGISPWSPIAVCKVVSKLSEVVSFGSQ